MIKGGQKFGEELLSLCNARVEEKGTTKISLSRSLGFNHKVAPCRLVVPFQNMLTPILPPSHEQAFIKQFNPFPGDVVSVESEWTICIIRCGDILEANKWAEVLDDALVLNSLQKPRKISILGTDGKVYSVLCKPKDDLRKDQRLMEFNNMINGFLKKDVDSIKRRMCKCSLIYLGDLLLTSGRYQNLCRDTPQRGVWTYRVGWQSTHSARYCHETTSRKGHNSEREIPQSHWP